MSARNLFRRLMTRSLRTPKAAPVRKRPPVLGRRFEVLEDRSVPAATIAYIDGHGLDPTSLAGAGLTVVPNTAGFPASDAGFASAFAAGGFDALVIGESVGDGSGLSAATKTNIANYASGGGTVIVLGSHGAQATFLNSVFGFSTASGGSQYGNEPVTRVAGTGPATLAAMSGTWYINNAPGQVTYTGNGGETAAFTSNYGSGYVDFLAWDFCCGSPAQTADWYSVLAADITVGSLTAAFDGSGNLVITDTTGVANNLTVSVGGSSLVVTDATQKFQAAPAGGVLSNGNKTLTIPFSSIAGSQVIFNTGGGNDTLTESFAGGNFAKQIAYNGGGNIDSLAFQDGSFASATFNYTNSTDGSVTYGTNSTAYTGLAPITSSVTAAAVTLNYGVSAETITVTDAGGGQTNVSSTAGETTTFPNPTGSLTINAGDGDDAVVVNSFGAGFNAALTIDGQNGTDAITVNPALNLSAGGGTLSLTGETITLNGGTVTTTGAQTYNGALKLGLNTVVNGSAVTFNGPVDAAATGGYTFLGSYQVSSGPSWFSNPPVYSARQAAALLFGGSPSQYAISIDSNTTNPATITFTGNYSVWGVSGAQVYPQDYSLDQGNPGYNDPGGAGTAASAYVNDNAGGAVNYVWVTGPAAVSLTVNSSGATTFGGAVGGTAPLASLTTDAGGTTTLNGGAVTTTGAQSYGDAVTLGAGTTLTSNAGGNVTFAAAVNGAFALAVNTAGTTTFGGAVGGTTALASLATDAGGSTAINGGSVTTTGNQTYGDNVTLGGASESLTATGAGTVTFGGTTTGGVPLTVTTNTGNVVINGAMTVGGNVVLTTRRPMINAPLNVGANNLTIQSPIGGYEIGGFVGADGLSGPDLANITVGGTFNLGNLSTQLGINSNGTIYPVVFPASITGPVNVRAYGFVNFINGPTSFAGPGTVTVTTTGGSGNVSVNHSTPAASLTTAGPLVVNAAGQFFVGSNGAGPATVTAPSLTATAASALFDGNVNVTGAASVAATTSTITGAGLLTAGTSATLAAVSGIGTAGTPLRVNTPTFANVQTATGGIYVNIWDTANVPHTVTSASATVSGDVVFVSTNGGGTNTNVFSSVTAANGNVDLSRTTAGNITLGNVTASTAGRTITATVQGVQNGINHTGGSVQTAGGAITLVADQMNLVGGTITATPAGTVTLRPWTNNQPIDLGATPANTLGLTDPALDTITANVLQIGNASSGVVTVSGPITPAAAANLSVTNGTDLAVNANVTTAGSIAFAFGQGGAGNAATLSGNLAGTSATVTGGGGTDSITVNTVASSPVLTLNGAGAADAYTVNHGAWTGTVAIADTGASGTDAATLYGTAAANTFNVNTAAAQTVRFGSPATEFVTYTANLETLTVNGQPTPDAPQAPVVSDAGDTFTVTPDAATAITINGGQPVSGTGDTLVLNAAPLIAPIAITNQSGGQPALPNGRITSGNRQAVLWNSIETLPVPLGLGGTFDFQPAGSTTQGGFLSVTPADSAAGGAYSAAQVGWVTAGSGAFDRPLVYGANGVPNSPRLAGLLQDGEWGYAGGGGNNGLFQVAVAPGALPDRLVQVTVFSGDTYAPRDGTNVYVRNLTTGTRTKLNPTLATLSTAGQTYQYVSYGGMIDPGSAATPGSTKVLLQVEFEAVYGWSSSFWTVSGVDVRPLGLIAPLTLTRAGGNGAQPGDGVTVDTYTGSGAAPFAELTVSPQLGTVTTADADAAVSGIQVVADGSGNFAFDVRRPTGPGSSVISVADVTGASATGFVGPTANDPGAASPNPYLLPTAYTQTYTAPPPPPASPPPPPAAVVMAFDFNSGASPTPANFVGVQPTAYTAALGRGWTTAVNGYDRGSGGTPAALYQDGAWGYGAGTFRVAVPNGSYDVRVYVGDPYTAWGGLTVSANGSAAVAVDSTANRFGYVTLYNVPVAAGTLDVTVTAAQGGVWVAAGVQLATAGSLPVPATPGATVLAGVLRLDFNGGSNDTAAGFTGATGAAYTPAAGTGWQGGVQTAERAAAIPGLTAAQASLYRDLAWGQGTGVFQVAVPTYPSTATYAARVYVGDSYANWGGITLRIEGNPAPVSVDTAANPFWSYLLTNGRDANGDGVLTLTVTGQVWVVNGIEVVQGTAANLPASAGPGAAPQLAAGGAVAGGSAAVLTADQLAPIAAEAVRRWAAAGLTAGEVAALRGTRYQVADLNGAGRLGEASLYGNLVTLDDDGAGRGWFVDATPADDAEFGRSGPAGYDLLTVVMHELGHVIGRDSLDPAVAGNDLMTATLDVGTRRTPAAAPAAKLLLADAAPVAAGTWDAPVALAPAASVPTAAPMTSAAAYAAVTPAKLAWLAPADDDWAFRGIDVG